MQCDGVRWSESKMVGVPSSAKHWIGVVRAARPRERGRMSDPRDESGLSGVILGQPRRLTSSQVTLAAGVQMHRARRFWRAMGFANVADDDVEFTDADVAALKRFLCLVDDEILDEEQAIALARLLGRATSRLATSNAEALGHALDACGAVDGQRVSAARRLVDRTLPELEALLVYSWYRHLAVAMERLQPEVRSTRTSMATVGFADLVGFTRLSRQLSDRDLVALVNRFEGGIGDIVTGSGGRLVKSIGDEVLFVADKPEIGANIALEIAERISRRPVPGIRVGLEFGDLITHAGDVFGDTVNLASRLTALSEPNQVLVGPRLATELATHRQYQLTELAPMQVRGFPPLSPSVLSRGRSMAAGQALNTH